MTNEAIPAAPARTTQRMDLPDSPANGREMMDSIPQMVFQADSEGLLIYANRAWYDYTGLPPATASPTPWHTIVHPQDSKNAVERWRTSVANGSGFEAELRLRRHDGGFCWHVVRAAPARDARGVGDLWAATATDIDDLRRVQRTLRHSEERLRLAQRVAGMGTWEWDIERDIMTWSPELEALYGLGDERFTGGFAAFVDRIHPGDRERMHESVEGLLATGLHEIEHRIVLPSGEVRWLAARGETFSDAEGRPLRAIGICLDITERKRSEEALRALDQRHKVLADAGAALSGAATPGAIADAALRCVVPGFADACTIELLDGGDLTLAATLAGPEFQSGLRGGEEGALRALESVQSLYIEEPAADGATTMRARIEHLDRPLGVMSLVRSAHRHPFDVADQLTIRELSARIGARLNDQLVNATKDEVLALVSHELRTPLTILKGNANTLRRHGDRIDPADRAEALKDIEADADRLEQIVRNMLVLAQNDSGRLTPGLEPLILSRVVEATVREHVGRQPAPPVVVTLEGERFMVTGHQAHLHQVITNLLSNAAKYGGNSQIDVVVRQEEDSAVVEVSDRGAGLSPGALRRVFDPFFRSASNSAKAPGVGLGLTVCRRLISAQGGAIRVAARPGGGTSFFVSLPLFADEPMEDTV